MAKLLSKHSSNPLQAPSDDLVNRKYLEELQPVLRREKGRGDRDPSSVHNNLSDTDELMCDSSEDAVYHDSVSYQDEVTSSQDHEGHGELEEEEQTLFLKDSQEQAQILAEIDDLEITVPMLKDDFQLIDRLGEGTFSSVYKAIDLEHHGKWYNAIWKGHHPQGSSALFQSVPYPPHSKVYVAIKRIYVTSSPSRIQNEIILMESCRGCRHVAQLITAFRAKDQVVAIMPYHRNVDFRNYCANVSLPTIQQYFRCLLRAMRDIHAREIIHRDIKPANFLFDPATGQGVVVDFGLAQKADYDVTTSCNHTSPSKDHPHGSLKSFSREDMQSMRDTLLDARKRSAGPSDRVGWFAEDTRHHIKANRAGTRGFRAPEVLFKCEDQNGALDIWSVGTILLSFLCRRFPIFNAGDDIEALMEIAAVLGRKRMEKCAQLHNRTFTTNVPSIDHAGIPWREFAERLNPSLTKKSPTRPHGRSSLGISDLPHASDGSSICATDPLLSDAFDLLEQMLRPDMTKRITARDALFHPFLTEGRSSSRSSLDDNDGMFDGEGDDDDDECVLESREYEDPDTGEIIIASGDDLYVPHPFGEGVCKKGHWIDEETGDHCCFEIVDDGTKAKPQKDLTKLSAERKAKKDKARRERTAKERNRGIYRLDLGPMKVVDASSPNASAPLHKVVKVRMKRLVAGEGIAIGLDPCEFHRSGVVDASFYESHVIPMEDEDDEGVCFMDDDEMCSDS